MQFADFSFKLVIINELLEKGSFTDELKFLMQKKEYEQAYAGFGDNFGYDKPIIEIQDFLRNVSLSQADLAAVESLTFDGGDEIYQIIIPFWDGEDDYFDVISVDGFEQLPNLVKVNNISMIDDTEIARCADAGFNCKLNKAFPF